jgi:DNA-binding NarL/FixJ family response regulator
MKRLIVISDVRLYRDGLSLLLAENSHAQIVAAVSAVDDALTWHARGGVDAVLVDLASALAREKLCVLVREIGSSCCVLALGLCEEEAEVVRCLELGVSGYLPREGSLAELIRCVEAACAGEFRCSARVAGILARRLARAPADGSGPDGAAQLTPREVSVLRLLHANRSNKEIAAELCIEVATVKNHVHNILGKLGVRRRVDAGTAYGNWQRAYVVPSESGSSRLRVAG